MIAFEQWDATMLPVQMLLQQLKCEPRQAVWRFEKLRGGDFLR